MALHFLGSLRGLRVQLLLWTVLPLTLILVGVTIAGISGHQNAMRSMVEELDARSARLVAAHLNEALTQRAALLQLLLESPTAISAESLDTFFDGGYALFNGPLIAQIRQSGRMAADPVSTCLYSRLNPDCTGYW